MEDNFNYVVKGSERIEEKHKNTAFKKSFVKHMEYYFDKIRRCNTNFQILKEMRNNWKLYVNAYKFAPAFWAAVQYDIQMCLVVELHSFLSTDKQDDSLLLYIDKLISNYQQIYDRKFFITLKNRNGETREEERKPFSNILPILEECKNNLSELLIKYPALKKVRSKVYVHIDKTAMDTELCNKKYLNSIKIEDTTTIIKTISDCLIKMYVGYTNVMHAVEYTNNNDIRNIFSVLETYDKYREEIFELKYKRDNK